LLSLPDCRIPFYTSSGRLVAHVIIAPRSSFLPNNSSGISSIIEIPEADAREYGETRVQLRENERYDYMVKPVSLGSKLKLRSSLSDSRLNFTQGEFDSGTIETRSFCGALLLELVECDTNDSNLIASALIEVRSLKLDYRSEYRGMLRRITDEMVALAIDCRQSTKVGLRSSFEDRNDTGWFQIQLELLREVVDSSEFASSLHRILTFPHERTSNSTESVATDYPIRWGVSEVRQLLSGTARRLLPETHPLRIHTEIRTIAGRVLAVRKSKDMDTPENRFIKHALLEFQAFLTRAEIVFEAKENWGISAELSRRLSARINELLDRSFFREIGVLLVAPLGSPVLQRKSGYREVLRWWLRFRTASEISWQGGEDLFRAGQRNVASLYEYWLFFELLEWYCRACRGGIRPSIEELVDGLNDGSPDLKLKERTHLGPFTGSFSGAGRKLNSRFSYNRRFRPTPDDRGASGSWTRALHPDYTLSFWPDGLSEAEAELQEVLVHIHFDAKYRVDTIEEIFGAEDDDDADEIAEGNYKRQDLLKMHAYRDAIKRSQGAYVLYPGRSVKAARFTGFHEILPGLGAFGISPDENGRAQGIGSLEKFLDEVLAHLSNRTTALERTGYHISEANRIGEKVVQYGDVKLSETDDLHGAGFRAPPPAEHMVLVAWCNNEVQMRLASGPDGLVYVRLGSRRGSLHVHPNLSATRHVLLRAEGGVVNPGLFVLREPGFRVYTRNELRREFEKKGMKGVSDWEGIMEKNDEDHIYAVFRTTLDPIYKSLEWDGNALMDLIEKFESDRRNKLVENAGRTSPYPRTIPLRDLLACQKK
jgi:predicted component of viral defense system (DUF524 family)